MLNLKQIQYFIAVSDNLSITKAAAILHIAQPALTRHIRSLEDDLGVALFLRKGRGLDLTSAGLAFRDRAKAILKDLDRARVEAKALSRGPNGRIDVGMPAAISQSLSKILIERMVSPPNSLALRIIDGWTGFIVEWLLLGRLDVGVIYDHASRSRLLHVEALAVERQYLVCSANSTLAHKKSISLAHLERIPLVLPSKDHGLRISVDKQFEAQGISPNVGLEVESILAIKQFVEAGEYCSILSRGEIVNEISSGKLIVLDTRPIFKRTLYLAWAHERSIDPPLQALLDVIREESTKLINSGAWGATLVSSSARR